MNNCAHYFKALIFGLVLCAILGERSIAQVTFPVNGTVEKDLVATRFVNATIHVDALTTIENGELIIQGQRIIAIGSSDDMVRTSQDRLRVIDLQGAHVYPSFIDLNSSYGTPKVERAGWDGKPHIEREKPSLGGWNEAIHPEYSTADEIAPNAAEAKAYIEMGFGAALSHNPDGISRGTSVLMTFGDNANKSLIAADVANHFSFKKGSSRQDYPSSLMGAVALLKQTYHDAEWYQELEEKQEGNLSLEAMINNWDLPAFFDTSNKLDILRADLIGDEFDVQYAFYGNGDEYQRIPEIKATEGMVVIPLDFPAAWDMTDPYLSRMISLGELKHWEMAPANAAMLEQEGVPFCITSKGCTSKDFFANLRKAVHHGLTEEMALKALTSLPAEMLGVEEEMGSLVVGSYANLLVSSHSIFTDEAIVLEQWVQGDVHVVKDRSLVAIQGNYNLNIDGTIYKLKVKGSKTSPKGTVLKIEKDTLKTALKIVQENGQLSMSMNGEDLGLTGVLRFSGLVHAESRIWDGEVQLPSGKWAHWTAVRQSGPEVIAKGKKDKKIELGNVIYPFVAFGNDSIPEEKATLIKNATIWTSEAAGIIENGQLLLLDGKIAAVGKNINTAEIFGKSSPDLEVIDAKGKHVTAGIIDEHSHIAITQGVNEGTQASSAEVSIESSVNSEDINIYRQLSGGVTTSQLLHGSANPIGGQSAIIKLKWGESPSDMLFEGAAPFIKFALGENVKQSNWGDRQTQRFPQTRMGVEQVFYDHFIRAREYGAAWDNYRSSMASLSRKQKRKGEIPQAPRVDLEMQTLWEILQGERFITCHSYRQDEINMLMHVADSMGFTLNTFTHILEGYKVADKMKEHGAGGSTFSDWWAYKFEVKDAIPHNGAILWEQGVVTAFNSDDAEMARRLNQEAAKAVKYGGVPEEEALKFVTLNPAKLLHIDHRVGSIKVGKDADIVIWSDHPMSIYAKAERTFVEGVCYWDIDEDEKKRELVEQERARIIQKMLKDSSGGKKKMPREKGKKHYHCDTMLKDEI